MTSSPLLRENWERLSAGECQAVVHDLVLPLLPHAFRFVELRRGGSSVATSNIAVFDYGGVGFFAGWIPLASAYFCTTDDDETFGMHLRRALSLGNT